MIYPSLRIEEQDLYGVASSDGATSFYLRASTHPSTFFITIDRRQQAHVEGVDDAEFSDRVKRALEDVVLPQDSRLVATHNFQTNPVRDLIHKLLTAPPENWSLTECSAVLNMLILMTAPTMDAVHIEIVDALKWDGQPLIQFAPYHKRVELICERLETQEGVVYYVNDETVFLTAPKLHHATSAMSMTMEFDNLLDKIDNIYYRLFIYGNDTYSLYHPTLRALQNDLGIELVDKLNDVVSAVEYRQNRSIYLHSSPNF